MNGNKLVCLTVCLMAFTFLFYGCGGDDGTDPVVENPSLASADIDSEGGSLESDNFSLTVPAGAFSAATELNLLATDTGDFPLEETTDAFHLTGLPAQWAGPLSLKVRYSGELSEDSFLVVGLPFEDEGSGIQDYQYQYLPVTVEEGFLVAELPASAPVPDKDLVDDALQIIGLTGMKFRSVSNAYGPVFEIYYYSEFQGVIDDIATDLIHAQAFWSSMGFSVEHAADSDYDPFPIQVQLKMAREWNLNPDRGGKAYVKISNRDAYSPSDFHYGGGRYILYHHACTQANLPWLDHIIGSYYFNIVHFQSTPWITIYSTNWLRDAIRTWSEEFFTTDTDHIPMMFHRNQTMVLGGLNHRNYNSATSYGNSCSALIKYLADRYGPGFLPVTYNAIRQQTMALDAMTDALPDDPSIWWPDFTREFITGQVYSVQPDSIVNLTAETWDITEAGTQNRDWDLSFSDLSARIVRFNLDANDLEDGASIQLLVSSEETDLENLEIQVYSLLDGQLEFMTRATDVTITDLDDLQSAGYDLLAVITCSEIIDDVPYNYTAVEFQANVVDGSGSIPAFVLGKFMMKYHAFFADGSENQGEIMAQQYAAGGMSGNTFSAVWDSTNTQGTRLSGSFEVALAENPLRVLNWSYEWRWDYADSDDYMLEQVSGGAVPFNYGGSNYLIFRLDDAAVCESLTQVDFIEVLGGEVQDELSSWSCNDNSYLNVYLVVDE